MDELFKNAALLVLGGLIQFLVARFNKNKAERDSGLVSDYIKITDMTGAQLERKINQVDRLEAKIDAQEAEQEAHRIARNKEIAELKQAHEAQITELQVRITDNGLETQKKITELQEQAKESTKKYRIMKGVAEKLIRALQENDPPIPIPDLNGDLVELGESAHELKLTREERERLKAAK